MNLMNLRSLMQADAAKLDYDVIIEEDGMGGILVHHMDEVGTTSYTVPYYEVFIEEVERETANHENFEDAFWAVLQEGYAA